MCNPIEPSRSLAPTRARLDGLNKRLRFRIVMARSAGCGSAAALRRRGPSAVTLSHTSDGKARVDGGQKSGATRTFEPGRTTRGARLTSVHGLRPMLPLQPRGPQSRWAAPSSRKRSVMSVMSGKRRKPFPPPRKARGRREKGNRRQCPRLPAAAKRSVRL